MKINIKSLRGAVVKRAKMSATGLKDLLISTRMKSLYWRTSMMVLSVIIGSLLSNLDILAPYVSAASITMLGLILGEVSKALNNHLSLKKKVDGAVIPE